MFAHLSSWQFCDNDACEHVKPSPALTLPKGERSCPSRVPNGKHPPKVQSTCLKDLAVRVWFSMALRVLPGALRKGRRRRGPLLIPNESHPGRRGNVAIVLSRPCSFLPARYAGQWKASVPGLSQPNGASVGRQGALAGRDPIAADVVLRQGFYCGGTAPSATKIRQFRRGFQKFCRPNRLDPFRIFYGPSAGRQLGSAHS